MTMKTTSVVLRTYPDCDYDHEIDRLVNEKIKKLGDKEIVSVTQNVVATKYVPFLFSSVDCLMVTAVILYKDR